MESAFPTPPRGKLAVEYLGHSGVVLVSDRGMKVAIDPYLTDTVPLTRICPVVCLPEDLNVDHVLLTHDHSDHTDPNTCLPIMRTRSALFWGPPSSLSVLRAAGARADRLHRLDRGATVELGDITVMAVHAEHTADSVGYVLHVSGRWIYHVGDTEESPELYWLHDRAVEVLFTCFSGRWEAIDATQAAALAEALAVRYVVPIHHDMFAENRADPATLISAVTSRSGCDARVKVLRPGDRWVYPED
jgi:L-ascorbate metabolism protein UlaG (beta-lactamase superfamily)